MNSKDAQNVIAISHQKQYNCTAQPLVSSLEVQKSAQPPLLAYILQDKIITTLTPKESKYNGYPANMKKKLPNVMHYNS